MCAVSAIMDIWKHQWEKDYCWPPGPWHGEPPIPYYPSLPTKEEIEDFRRIYEKAKRFDKETGQPDCENKEKIRLLKELAEKLGVLDQISFIDEN